MDLKIIKRQYKQLKGYTPCQQVIKYCEIELGKLEKNQTNQEMIIKLTRLLWRTRLLIHPLFLKTLVPISDPQLHRSRIKFLKISLIGYRTMMSLYSQQQIFKSKPNGNSAKKESQEHQQQENNLKNANQEKDPKRSLNEKKEILSQLHEKFLLKTIQLIQWWLLFDQSKNEINEEQAVWCLNKLEKYSQEGNLKYRELYIQIVCSCLLDKNLCEQKNVYIKKGLHNVKSWLSNTKSAKPLYNHKKNNNSNNNNNNNNNNLLKEGSDKLFNFAKISLYNLFYNQTKTTNQKTKNWEEIKLLLEKALLKSGKKKPKKLYLLMKWIFCFLFKILSNNKSSGNNNSNNNNRKKSNSHLVKDLFVYLKEGFQKVIENSQNNLHTIKLYSSYLAYLTCSFTTHTNNENIGFKKGEILLLTLNNLHSKINNLDNTIIKKSNNSKLKEKKLLISIKSNIKNQNYEFNGEENSEKKKRESK